MHFVYWFRKDLRLQDSKALSEFLKDTGSSNFSFLYIKNRNSYSYFGEKRISFLRNSLEDLSTELKNLNFHLQILFGKSSEVFKQLTEKYGEIQLYFNQQIEPYCKSRDEEVKKIIEDCGGNCKIFSDTTLFFPGEILNNEGNHFKVFTPFKNKSLQVLSNGHYKNYMPDFSGLDGKKEILIDSEFVTKIDRIIENNSETGIYKGGRKEGINLLKEFYDNNLSGYKSNRDYPFKSGTSKLSAHIHFGTIGIRELFRTAFKKLTESRTQKVKDEIQTWINELLWREFYYDITFHSPRIMHESFKKEYDRLIWNYNESDFNKWCRGETGFPIVDAGMRQLNTEGWMHNRVRMITAMFLTKDLFIDWRLGEKYFAEKLIDMDFANNNGGWQWSASTGVDSQPYFRIFNPYLQSKKFDPEGNYIRKYVGELRHLPAEFIHEPNIMEKAAQVKYNFVPGKDYPLPMTDHIKAKARAIEKFKMVNSPGYFT